LPPTPRSTLFPYTTLFRSLLIGDLALTNMGLSDKVAALALAERAIAANPIEKDALNGPLPIEIFARVAACVGEPDRAIATLQKRSEERRVGKECRYQEWTQ